MSLALILIGFGVFVIVIHLKEVGELGSTDEG